MIGDKSDNHLSRLVTPGQAGSRLDAFLANEIADLSRTRAAWHIVHGHVKLDDPKGRSKPGFRVRLGTRVTLDLQPPDLSDLVAQDLGLDVIWEDEHLLVVHKPPGMVVHPAAGHPDGTLLNALLHHVPAIARVGDASRPGLVHRIDKDTSGLLMVSKTEVALQRMTADLAAHKVERRYVAICLGRLRQDQLTIDTAYGRHPRDRKRFSGRVTSDRRAITHLEVRARSATCTLVVCTLETGRTYQIRVHLSERGHPIAGDETYGGRRAHSKTNRTLPEIALLSRIPRQALHAYALGFRHPVNGQQLRFELPWPEDLLATAQGLFGQDEIALPPLDEPVWPAKG